MNELHPAHTNLTRGMSLKTPPPDGNIGPWFATGRRQARPSPHLVFGTPRVGDKVLKADVL